MINMRAGTAIDFTRAELERAVAAPFEAQGHEITVACVAPGEIEPELARAMASDIDVLIIGGGDGTVRAAARHLLGTGKALGVLPLGTMNRLAKDLDIPLSLEAAAAFLAAKARPRAIDVATVNGTIFLCNSIMGATLRYSSGRARVRGDPAVKRLPAYFAMFRDILSSRHKLSVVVDNGEERLRVRALSLIVTNNGYDESKGWFRRPHLAGGFLTMYISKHRSGLGLAFALLRALIGRWHGDPEMMKLTGAEFVVSTKKRRKRLANDGELAKFDTPLRYAVLPSALRVLMAAERSPADGEHEVG